MSYAKCKTEMKFVLKSGFKIPVEEEKDTDSMLNCEVLRIEKMINQTLTHPILASKLSHITSLLSRTKNLGLNPKTTQNVINGLKLRNSTKTKTLSNSNRLTIDSNTNKLSQKYSFISDTELKKLKGPYDNEKKRLFDLEISDMEDHISSPSDTKIPLIGNNKEQNNCNFLALSSVKEKGKMRRRLKAKRNECVNNRILKHVSGILHKLSCKKERLSRIKELKKTPKKTQQVKSETETFNLLNYLNSHKEIKTIVKTFMTSNPSKQASIIAGFKKGFDKILENSLGADLYLQIFSCMKKLHKSSKELIIQTDFIAPAFSITCNTLIHILSNLNAEENEIDLIYNQFNNTECWTNMVSHKHGRNLVEFFLSNTYVNNSSKHLLLFKVLEDNFVHFAQSNYSTFVIQIYVKCYHKNESFDKILTYFSELTITRNGIFVVISALKGYTKPHLETLIDKIILHSEKLCTNVYASTLIEFVFKNFEMAISKFLNTKLQSLFGKPNFNYNQ